MSGLRRLALSEVQKSGSKKSMDALDQAMKAKQPKKKK